MKWVIGRSGVSFEMLGGASSLSPFLISVSNSDKRKGFVCVEAHAGDLRMRDPQCLEDMSDCSPVAGVGQRGKGSLGEDALGRSVRGLGRRFEKRLRRGMMR